MRDQVAFSGDMRWGGMGTFRFSMRTAFGEEAMGAKVGPSPPSISMLVFSSSGSETGFPKNDSSASMGARTRSGEVFSTKKTYDRKIHSPIEELASTVSGITSSSLGFRAVGAGMLNVYVRNSS